MCGITEDGLKNLEKEDVLFTEVTNDDKWYRKQTGYCI
jgi:hypothetical protein